ncbi:MAG: hypothetical protein EBW20_12180 [Betaproteobacteria bacterium]|nr:hypothetical protein [Betaproteobacteria bacterium]
MAQGFHLHRFDEGFASAFQMLSKLPGARSGKLGYVCQFDAGSGMWLAAAKALGAVRLLGISTPDRIEQAPCVEPELLKTIDLHQVKVSLPQPADLVLCINFIQRLDQARAGDFVADLCKSAPRVLGQHLKGAGKSFVKSMQVKTLGQERNLDLREDPVRSARRSAKMRR